MRKLQVVPSLDDDAASLAFEMVLTCCRCRWLAAGRYEREGNKHLSEKVAAGSMTWVGMIFYHVE